MRKTAEQELNLAGSPDQEEAEPSLGSQVLNASEPEPPPPARLDLGAEATTEAAVVRVERDTSSARFAVRLWNVYVQAALHERGRGTGGAAGLAFLTFAVAVSATLVLAALGLVIMVLTYAYTRLS